MKNFRTLKHVPLTAALFALCSVPAVVTARQDQQTPQSDPGQQPVAQHGQKHEDELANLNLSDDQKTQVQKIHESMKSQIGAIRNDASLSADQQRAKVQGIRKSGHDQIVQLLTPEQRQQMKSDERERKAAKQQGSQAPPPQQ
jgi:Spy/CpxP family protein refolding chaperone